MQFDSLAAFMSMEGHGIFVWSVYAIAFVVLATLFLVPLRKNRQFFTEQAMLAKREQRIQQQAEG
ncbi:heme exporter protein CcmD [Oceanicoccus sagamiensis]|uniref:Heme exporter protein D n=1 Tax=Oceanicoccus sagamiensis TaxID=716816 RepID=A0A1X9NEG3_9GAMM|nr:heme exporter protein CcmD [Oceanicoccus sagamiensis]ARN75444.1 heme exporter protein CcmD [Oceanicoccus sagamiensis]